jgi:hypothetical protein
MDPATAIKRATKVVEEYRKKLPDGTLESVQASEHAGARLAALVKLYELLRRIDETSIMDDIGFEGICREADSLFANVALDRTVVKHYRSQLPSFNETRRAVRKAIETVFLGILNLPNTLPRTGLDVPIEYLRLQSPLDGDPPAEPLPEIVLPEPAVEEAQPRPSPHRQIA